MSVNKAILIGNVGKDPEIRSTNDGREIASFSIATGERWTDKKTGEVKEKSEWHKIVVFSQGLVGIVKNYVKKGSKLYIEGQIATRKWTDKDGVDKYTTEIVLQSFSSSLQILNSPYKSQGEVENSHSSTRREEGESFNARKFVDDAKVEHEEYEDEIPF